jgi:hypothetical protein
MHLLGEGYHVIALAEPAKRFVVKYAKNGEGIPPLAPRQEQPRREEWAHDHGIKPDGSLHPTIWQHIRSLEVYGPLAVPNRVYLAESAYGLLNEDQRRALERFRVDRNSCDPWAAVLGRSVSTTPTTSRTRSGHPMAWRSPFW